MYRILLASDLVVEIESGVREGDKINEREKEIISTSKSRSLSLPLSTPARSIVTLKVILLTPTLKCCSEERLLANGITLSHQRNLKVS
jgi:hypothetical protein